jgi:hypothetical protein
MTPTDRKAFLETVVGFAELKGKQLSAPALELFWHSMQHWDIDDFRQAANQLIRSCEFMPTPKYFEALRKAGRPTAGEAWAEVLRYVRTDYSPNFPARLNGSAGLLSDPLVDRAVNAIGGYRAIANSDMDATQFLERRFCEHFESIQESEDIRGAVPQIAYSGVRRQLNGPQSAGSLLGRLDFGEPQE